MGQVFEREITGRPLKNGFLPIPAQYHQLFPDADSSTKIRVYFDTATEAVKKNFQKNKRITGLTGWFSQTGARTGDRVSIEALGRGEYRMTLIPKQSPRSSLPTLLSTEAARWYRTFIQKTYDEDDGFKGYTGGDSDKEWTKYIESVLTNWGRNDGFDVFPDFDSPVRIDLRWCQNKRDVVAVEHENVGDMHGKPLGESSIGREVEKLLDNTNAPLRVLITYFRDSAFETEFFSFKAQLEKEIQTREKYDFEFLLMAGPWNIAEPQEFVAYVFRPRISAELVPPHYPS